MVRSRRARVSAGLAAVVLGAALLAGCPGGGGEDASSVLMMEGFMRQPDVFRSFARLSVATAIASAQLTPEQAGELAKVAEARGGDIRGAVDGLFAPMALVSAKLDDVSRQVVSGGTEGQSVDEIMMDLMAGAEGDPAMAEFMELSNMMESGSPDKMRELLAPFIAEIQGVVDSLSADQKLALSGVQQEVQSAFQYYYPEFGVQEIDMGEWTEEAPMATEEAPLPQPEEQAEEGEGWEMDEDFTPADEQEMAITGRIDAVLKALGYADPAERPDLAEAARPIIVEYVEAGEENQWQIAEDIAKRLIDEVGVNPQILQERAEMKLVSIVGCESAVELLTLAAGR